jgi:uncharacterized membrane protein
MIKVEKSVIINKPVTEVFAYTESFDKTAEWQGGVLSVKLEQGSEGSVGSKYTEVRKFLGREMKTTLEITEFERDSRWAAKALSGPVPYEAATTYEQVPGGTRVTTVVSAEPTGFFKLAEGVVAGSLEKSLEEDLDRLKGILESR